MTLFRNFTIPLWELFVGNLLLAVTCVFYMLWWGLSFGKAGSDDSAAIFVAIALVAGVCAIAVISLGIVSLQSSRSSASSMVILVGAAALYLLMQFVTQVVFQRIPTSELLIITIWATIQFLAVNSLASTGRLSTVALVTFFVLIAVATSIGLVCYTIFYRLDEAAQYWIGFIPIAVDGAVGIVLLCLLATLG
jgi:hypothetical protein